jgi:hypothetical protein
VVDLRTRDRDVALVVAGLLACGVSAIVAIPIASAALMYLHEDLACRRDEVIARDELARRMTHAQSCAIPDSARSVRIPDSTN